MRLTTELLDALVQREVEVRARFEGARTAFMQALEALLIEAFEPFACGARADAFNEHFATFQGQSGILLIQNLARTATHALEGGAKRLTFWVSGCSAVSTCALLVGGGILFCEKCSVQRPPTG